MTSGGSRCRGCLHPADAIERPVDELCWDVSRVKATAAKAAALGRRCITRWWGVFYASVLWGGVVVMFAGAAYVCEKCSPAVAL